MPVTSWRSPATPPRLCCRLLRCDGADGSSRGFDGMALGDGNPVLQRLSVRLAPASAPDLSLRTQVLGPWEPLEYGGTRQ